METMLKSKGIWKYTKVAIPEPTNASTKFSIDGKEDEVVGAITTYISWEIYFHISGIDFPHLVWNKFNTMFDQFDEAMSCSWRKS
jgi:hypothetical protein